MCGRNIRRGRYAYPSIFCKVQRSTLKDSPLSSGTKFGMLTVLMHIAECVEEVYVTEYEMNKLIKETFEL